MREFKSCLNEDQPPEYRKKEARRFSNLRASEGLKILSYFPQYFF